jgi:hypothetical protein
MSSQSTIPTSVPAVLQGVDLNKYKQCKSKLSPNCLGTNEKIHFRGRSCKLCYNQERLIYQTNKNAQKRIKGLLLLQQNIQSPQKL